MGGTGWAGGMGAGQRRPRPKHLLSPAFLASSPLHYHHHHHPPPPSRRRRAIVSPRCSPRRTAATCCTRASSSCCGPSSSSWAVRGCCVLLLMCAAVSCCCGLLPPAATVLSLPLLFAGCGCAAAASMLCALPACNTPCLPPAHKLKTQLPKQTHNFQNTKLQRTLPCTLHNRNNSLLLHALDPALHPHARGQGQVDLRRRVEGLGAHGRLLRQRVAARCAFECVCVLCVVCLWADCT